jgi:hypothetical protein
MAVSGMLKFAFMLITHRPSGRPFNGMITINAEMIPGIRVSLHPEGHFQKSRVSH